jgi:hypothetical protein
MQQGTVPSATCDGRGLPEAPKVLRKRASNMAVRCCGSSPFFGAGTRSLDEKAATAAARRCESTCVNVFIQSSCATQTSCQTNSHTFLLRTDVLLTQRSPSAPALKQADPRVAARACQCHACSTAGGSLGSDRGQMRHEGAVLRTSPCAHQPPFSR